MTPDTPLYNSLNEPYLIIVDDDPDDLDLIKEIYSEIKLDHRVKFLNSGEALLDHNISKPRTVE